MSLGRTREVKGRGCHEGDGGSGEKQTKGEEGSTYRRPGRRLIRVRSGERCLSLDIRYCVCFTTFPKTFLREAIFLIKKKMQLIKYLEFFSKASHKVTILFIPQIPLVWSMKFKIVHSKILPEVKMLTKDLQLHWNDLVIDWKLENLRIRPFESWLYHHCLPPHLIHLFH